MKTSLEALSYTLELIDELEEAGIEVDKHGYPQDSPYTRDLAEKYNGPERIPPEKWVHVSFTLKEEGHRDLLMEKKKALNWLGVTFDSGGIGNQRRWEMDWSFRFTPGEPNPSKEAASEIVEDLIDDIDKEKE